MVFKEGHNWKACYDETQNNYTAVYYLRGSTVSGIRYYELNKETYEKLTPEDNKEAINLILKSRELYYSQTEQNCGPVHKIRDDNWEQICAGLLNSASLYRIP